MEKHEIDFTLHYSEVMSAMRSHGLLLGSYDALGRADIMTIGWGSIGSIWGEKIWMVLVRPSRHTYRNIEHSQCFTVNVPASDMQKACVICGSKSGKELDKFELCGLHEEKGLHVLAPTVRECPMVYECQVVHRNDILPEKLSDEILRGSYINGDFHRIYFGKILSARATGNAAELI